MTASWPSRPLSGPFVTNELDHAGSEHLDPSYVARYDTKQKYDPAPDVAALRGRGVDGRSTIIDMGCGTGVFTLAIAPHCRRVIAVDVSQPMLDRLSAATKDREIDKVEFVRARGSSPTSTRGTRSTTRSPETRCTSSPTSGKPWH
jgi:SAM-dependent methyltransferase